MSYPPGYPGYPPIPQTPQSGPVYPPRNDVEGIGFENLMIGPSYPPQPTVPYPTGPVPFSGYEAPPASYGPIYPETTHGASQFPMPSGINFGTAANVAHAATAFQAPVRPMPTSYPIVNPPYPSGPPPTGASTSMQYPQQHGVQTKGNSFHGTSSAPSAPFAHHQPQSYHGTPSNPSTTHSTPSRPTQQPSIKANRGTVKPCASFNPQADAEVIRKAVGGVGTNVKAIVSILSTRNNQQRRKIALEYKTQFGRDLNTDLKYAVSGNLENLLLAMMRSPLESDAVELRKAMKGAGTDESVLIEILCSRTNTEIYGIKRTYKDLHGRDLEKDVISETSGHFKKFLVSLLQANRDESMNVDYDRARADAHALYAAGEKRWGTDEARFNAILASRSFPQLRATFNEYAKISKYDIEKSIEREMSGDLKNSMVTLVRCVRNMPAYFAMKLYKSMKGLGTDDSTLIRVVVTRCEVDMLDIKQEFERHYRKSLASFIKGDTSGNYCNTLLALIGESQK